jgi:hypothetical protein
MSILLCAAATSLTAQTLGQFAGAGAAADGEGSVFMLAGNGAFRTGVSTRFNISGVSDFGLQLGLDRSLGGESFFGGGIDFKIVILEDTERLPVNLALDASFGSLTSGDAGRFLFGLGILASGRIAAGAGREIEPYCSLVADIERIDIKGGSPSLADCLCPGSDDETDARAIGRIGVKIPVSSGAQILVEADIQRRPLFGAGFNIVF